MSNKAGKQQAKLIDDETLVFLTKQRGEDTQISANIVIDQHITDFRYEHAERFNNWQTDELYIEQANMAEAVFLEKIHDQEMATVLTRHIEDSASQRAIFEDQRTFNNIINEMKSLTIQCAQNKAAAERMKRAKAVLKERRNAVRQHLLRIEARQERERKSLAASQGRTLKQRKLVRGVILRDVEDPEIRIILSGKEFNARTLGEENAQADGVRSEANKKFHAIVLAQMVINTKEVEQLREEHLLHHKYASRYCERELEIIDENEAILFEHTAKEQKLEANQNAQINSEEDRITNMVATALAHETELKVKAAANIVRESHRTEANRLKIKQMKETAQRAMDFWQGEESHLMAHLKKRDLEQVYESVKKEFLSRDRNSQNIDLLDEASDDAVEDISTSSVADTNIEAQRAREMALLEGLKKEHRNSLRRMRAVHLKIRDQNRSEQQKSLRAILAARDDDINGLKVSQGKEILDLQESLNQQSNDDDSGNNRAYAQLPKHMADGLKSGKSVPAETFESLTFLSADISNLSTLYSRTHPTQLVNLINKVHSALDEVLEGFEDIVKIDSIGDAYCVVSGVASRGKNAKAVAINVVTLGLAMTKAVQDLELHGQSVDSVSIRVGIHSGAAIGGITNPIMPKFSVLGDAPVITGLLEQSSRANGVHISGATHDLVKDKFESDVSESMTFRGQRLPTFWAVEESGTSIKKRSARGGRGTAAQ